MLHLFGTVSQLLLLVGCHLLIFVFHIVSISFNHISHSNEFPNYKSYRNNLHDKVMRLPCAHIFHCECISEWLTKSCTCPVCRYELQTDDPMYEKGRLERMKHRKPRYAKYELERMRIRDLSALCSRLKIPTDCMTEKKELIRSILESGKVDMIIAPKPVEYKLSELKGLGVGKLKRAMGDAGVFFDAKDVIEKEDMVMIFVNSGRVVLLAEEDTSMEDSDGFSVDTDEDLKETEHISKRPRNIDAEDFDPLNQSSSTGSCAVELNEKNDNELYDNDTVRSSVPSETIDTKDTNLYDDQNDHQNDRMQEEPQISDFPHTHSSNSASHYRNGNTNNYVAFSSRSIAELRRLAYELKVDISDCIEKREMIERLAAHVSVSGR